MLAFHLEARLGSFNLDVSLRTHARRVVLFGPSGSGKSVTLRTLAGLQRPRRGRIELDDLVLLDTTRSIDLPPQQRAIGYVPQGAPLFPHLSVVENVTYGLRGRPARERQARAEELLELVNLAGYGPRRVSQLSGGEQQRVALARALARPTRLLLLDEPFSALDAPVRSGLRDQLIDLQRRLDVTWVFVTHDLEEAYLLADEIAVYHQGCVVQHGTRDEVLLRPATVDVARLVDIRNLVPCTTSGRGRVALDGTDVTLLACQPPAAGAAVWACIRAEDLHLQRGPETVDDSVSGTWLGGSIVAERHLGLTVSLQFRVDGGCQAPSLWVDVSRQVYGALVERAPESWMLFVPREAVWLVPRTGDDLARS